MIELTVNRDEVHTPMQKEGIFHLQMPGALAGHQKWTKQMAQPYTWAVEMER
jgi:hypothetical protein